MNKLSKHETGHIINKYDIQLNDSKIIVKFQVINLRYFVFSINIKYWKFNINSLTFIRNYKL